MYRYHPDDPRSRLEGYEGSLTQDENAALEELQSAAGDLDLRFVRGDYGDGFESGEHAAVEPLRLCLLRFLRMNGFSVSSALSQLKDCVEHRRQHPTDKLLSKPPRDVLACDVDEFNSFYPRWLMGYDRLGRPIVATKYGSLRLWQMTKLTTVERMVDLHVREQELLLRVLRRRTLGGGGGGGDGDGGDGTASQDGGGDRHIVDTAVIVMDMAGLTLRHVTKSFVKLLKVRAQMDHFLFPEMMGKCLIVNTPGVFSHVWALFSPFVDERTRSQISIIARPQDWKKALQEIADADQLSPEYGGTGPRREDLPPLADALLAAGSRDGAGGHAHDQHGHSAEGGEGDLEDGVRPHVLHVPPPRERDLEEDEKEEEEDFASKGSGRRGWFGGGAVASSWGPLAWVWGAWGGGGGAADGGGVRGDAEDSIVTADEEFFDALAELDQPLPFRSGGGGSEIRQRGRGRQRSESHGTDTGTGTGTKSRDDIEVGPLASSPGGSTYNAVRPRGVGKGRGEGAAAGEGPGAGERRPCRRVLSAALGWCYAPVLRKLNRRSVEQLARWLCFANAVSALLAVAVVVAGAFSLSRATVLGLQWCAITAVCLGSLLLLLALVGTAGARLRNRFSLLGFAALEAGVALGLLLSGTWCLALAGGSATISDFTWEAMTTERGITGTKEDFIGGAQSRLLFLGASGLVLALFSVVGPCLLASVLLGKIKNMEAGRGARRDDDKRFLQLRRSAHEANALCTIFACVCTGYGGYALSFTVALGLGANVTSTYLLVAGGYLLLLAGAVGVWAARSGRPDAFRIHFGALLPAGALYASLTVVQLVSVGPSDGRVAASWEDLRPEGESLYGIQTSVRTMLIVGGVLSAVTFALVVCSAVSSWAARHALLGLPEGSPRRHRRLARLSRGEKMVAGWALALAATSTFIDGSFAVFSAWLARDGEQAGVWCLVLWRAMGRGDHRYVEGETFIVATAVIVAAVIGPGALLYAWAVYCRRGFRFSVGLLVCTASLHTQVLRYVTSADDSSESSAESGSKAFFIAASVVLALLQIVGALAVLLYNVRRMTKRVHAAEVQYRALLLEHGRLSGKTEFGLGGSGGDGGGGGGGLRRRESRDGGSASRKLGDEE